MASTLSQKWLPFLPKSSKCCMFCTIQFCSNFTSMWSKYLPNNVWRDFRLPMSNVSVSNHGNGSIKYPIRKSIFEVNLLWKLSRTKVANADTRSLKSLHTFWYVYGPHAGKILKYYNMFIAHKDIFQRTLWTH